MYKICLFSFNAKITSYFADKTFSDPICTFSLLICTRLRTEANKFESSLVVTIACKSSLLSFIEGKF